MRLIVFRHGIAIEREDPECPPDPERALTAEGRRRTKRAARGLRRLGVAPRHIFSSPYRRAVQTADIAAKVLTNNDVPVLDIDELLPDRHPQEFLRVIRDVKEGDVLCAGHSPHLDMLIATSVGSLATFTRLKKAGAACISFHPDRPRGELCWMVGARTLRAMGKS